MATQTDINTARPALLFMPDISGFTEFVTGTEIIHAQRIIQEVLEVIIESNQLGLVVGEIEGDAVFFYRLGSPPSLVQLLHQVETMFTSFHQHLRAYDIQRICPCPACSSAVRLQLKIIAHYGEVSGFFVKQHHKLFGREVIVLHRLLKNQLNKKEYALLTQALVNHAGPALELPQWFSPEDAGELYDVGEIRFQVADLSTLRDQLPHFKTPGERLFAKTKLMNSFEVPVETEAEKVFGTIFDLGLRPRWMQEIKEVEIISNDLIRRKGTRFAYHTNNSKSAVWVTDYAEIGEGAAELIEMEENALWGIRFAVRAVEKKSSRLRCELFVNKNPLKRIYFSLFQKDTIIRNLKRSMEDLREFCTKDFVLEQPEVEKAN